MHHLPVRRRLDTPSIAVCRGRSRRGGAVRTLLVLLAIAGATGGGAWYYFGQQTETEVRPLTATVTRGPFSHVVTEKGEVESSSNIEVRCEVQTKGASGTSILEIVPEGTIVDKGDLIARLDSSSLESEYNQQQIKVNASQAIVIKARSTAETAKIAREEYLNGTYKQEEQTLQSEVSVAEENLSRAQDYAAYSRKLAAKGYVTPLQLEADEFAVEKAEMELEAAKTRLDVLRKYTKLKMLATLEADIEAANATLQSEEQNLRLDQDKLKLVEEQIGKCDVRAPSPGQVVYANSSGGGGMRGGGGSEVIIEPGTMVRERQTIVRLPDPAKMQVKAKVNESRIDRVSEGMGAIVKLDAFPEEELQGVVRRVDDYPVAGNWFSNVKEYGTFVEIINPPPNKLRPGLTAEVQIFVEQLDDAVQVPVQAILEHGGQHFCLTYTQHKLTAVEVEVGSTNEKFVVLKRGLDKGAEVLVNPRRYADRVDLPKIAELESKRMLATKVPPPSAARKEEPKHVGGLAEKPGAEKKPAAEEQAATAGAGGGNGAGEAAAAEPGEKKKKRSGGTGGGMGDFASMDPAQMATMFLERSDTDGDGKLSEEEYPEQMRSRFAGSDTNGDKFVDKQEIAAGIRKMQAQMKAGGGMPGGGRPPAAGG